jgi:hypothetical protein
MAGWGDGPFLGGSVFETPPAPQQPAPPLPNMSPVYVYGAGVSATQNTGGSLTGSVEIPHEGMKIFDHGVRIS